MKKQLLKAKMIEKEITAKEISNKLDINQATFSKKLNEKNSFTVLELKRLIDILGLAPEEILEIFFSA